MTTDSANTTDEVKEQVIKFLTDLMKKSTLQWSEFFEAVGEASLDLESKFVSSVLANLPDCEDE